jgi:hypothetical protein
MDARSLIWNIPDEETLRRNLRRERLTRLAWILLGVLLFCLLISCMLGVPQSFLGEWWVKPPRYPGATLVDYRKGEVCQMPARATYCYEWFYRTQDPVDQVKAYFEGLDRGFRPPIRFEWKRGQRFGPNWVAAGCRAVISTLSCFQIIVRPVNGETEVYILESGRMGW